MPDSRVGDLQFNVPQGWKKVESANRVTLVPKNLQKGSTCFIGFLPAQTLKGDLRSWYNATLTDFQREFKVQQRGETTVEHNPNGFEVMRTDERISSAQLGYGVFVFAAAHAAGRVQAYFFLDNSGSYSYNDAFSDMEHSLHFAGAKSSEPSEGSKNGVSGGLHGLYIGYKMRGMAGLETHLEYLVFFPDGNLIRFLPEQGLQHFDFAATLKDSRDYCGRYRVDGNRIAILWGDNNKETAARSGTRLDIEKDEYFPVSNDNGLTLNGVYQREGADLARYKLRFTSDGRFADNGLLATVSDKNPRPGNGSYAIADNTLTLKFADGRKFALSFFLFPEPPAGQAPQRIHVNTYPLNLAR